MDEDLRLDDFERFMYDEFGHIFPEMFPLTTGFNRYGDLMYDSAMAHDMFCAWKAHLRFSEWEKKRRARQMGKVISLVTPQCEA